MLALVAAAQSPGLDQRSELGIAPFVGKLDSRPELGCKRNPLAEDALMVLQRELTRSELRVRAQHRCDFSDAGFDVRVAECPGHPDSVVTILVEVQIIDAIDVDRRHRLAAPPSSGDPLPSPPDTGRGRTEFTVELAAL